MANREVVEVCPRYHSATKYLCTHQLYPTIYYIHARPQGAMLPRGAHGWRLCNSDAWCDSIAWADAVVKPQHYHNITTYNNVSPHYISHLSSLLTLIQHSEHVSYAGTYFRQSVPLCVPCVPTRYRRVAHVLQHPHIILHHVGTHQHAQHTHKPHSNSSYVLLMYANLSNPSVVQMTILCGLYLAVVMKDQQRKATSKL